MDTMKKFLLLGAFVLVPAALTGCSCVTGDCPPAPAVSEAPAPAPAPEPEVLAASDPFCPLGPGRCRIIPPGTMIYSDPPTMTISSTGEVLSRTSATYKPAVSGAVYEPAPQAVAVVATYDVPRSANVRTL